MDLLLRCYRLACGRSLAQGLVAGGADFEGLVNGIAAFAGLACLAGLLIGARLWALGSHAQNYHQSSIGKKTVLTSFATALLVGGAVEIIDFFLAAGGSLN